VTAWTARSVAVNSPVTRSVAPRVIHAQGEGELVTACGTARVKLRGGLYPACGTGAEVTCEECLEVMSLQAPGLR
jgi:hypothetical protein